MCRRAVLDLSGLEVANYATNGSMLGHGRQGGQGDTLSCTLCNKARAQAVPAKIARNAGQGGTALYNGCHRSRGQRIADTIFP